MSAADIDATLGERALILRVQDRAGRGPYRPGLSRLWVDHDGPVNPPWWVELGIPMADAHSRLIGPYAFGCGFRTINQLQSWFSEAERKRLNRLGFAVAAIKPAKIFFETPTQVVFGTMEPLAGFPCEPMAAFRKVA